MVTGYAVLSVIPSIYLAAPDESSAFVVLPGQKWLLERRGYEAAILTGIGSLCGVMRAGDPQPGAHRSGAHAAHHSGAASGLDSLTISLFMLMSEWPKGGDRGPTNWARFRAAWTQLGAGPVDVLPVGPAGLHLDVSQLRAGVGGVREFAAGLHRLVCRPDGADEFDHGHARAAAAHQHLDRSVAGLLLRGTFAGSLGGLFAAFFPVVTGGIGAFLAGHATAQRDDRTFIVSQGVSKLVYYVGGFLLFFLPGLSLARGGLAAMVSTIYTPGTPEMYLVAVRLAVAGAVSFVLLIPYARFSGALSGAARLSRGQHRHVDHHRGGAPAHDRLRRIADCDPGHGDWLDPVVLRHPADELPRRAAGADHVEHGGHRAGFCALAGVGVRSP